MRVSFAAILAVIALLFGLTVASSGTASAQDTRKFDLGSLVATTAKTELKDQPLVDGAKLVEMPVNAQAIVLGGPFNDGWYWLNYNGTQGYAQSQYLVPVDANYQPVPEATTPPTIAPTTPPTDTAQPVATDTPQPAATGTPVTGGTPITGGTPVPGPSGGVTIPSTPGNYTGLWLAEMAKGGNIRVAPGFDQKVLKNWWAGRRVLLYEAVPDGKGAAWYRVSDPPEEPMWVHSSLVKPVAPVKFEGAKYKGRWVNVNVTQQVVTAYEDGIPVKVTLCSTGTIAAKVNPDTGKRDDNRTEIGVWKIYYRVLSQEMKGGSKAAGDYYDLKDVKWVQYFHNSGEALHGTYWHDDFGHPHSHGCVNLSNAIAEWFYGWAKVGTTVWVHY